MTLLVNKTSLELWVQEVKRAEDDCATVLNQDVEAYLVFLLMRFMNKPEIANQIVTTNFLESLHQGSSERELSLQRVGDQCLILTGLFPRVAEKRHVKMTYFIDIGRASYFAISHKTNDLYGLLATQFVVIMDVLQSLRQYSKSTPDLLPMEAYDLWHEAGSHRALKILKSYTQAK